MAGEKSVHRNGGCRLLPSSVIHMSDRCQFCRKRIVEVFWKLNGNKVESKERDQGNDEMIWIERRHNRGKLASNLRETSHSELKLRKSDELERIENIKRNRRLFQRTRGKIKETTSQSWLLLLLFLLPVPSNQVPHLSQITAAAAAATTTTTQLTTTTSTRVNKQQLLPSSLVVYSSRQHHDDEQIITPQPLLFLTPASGASGSQHQQLHPDAPKIIPLSALGSYQEGSELKLFCSASAPPSAGRLQFEWRKNQDFFQAPNDVDQATDHRHGTSSKVVMSGKNVHISMMDDSSSLLRINHLEAEDTGNYTCFARNQHGFDSSTVRVNVNVRLKWIREPASEIQIKAGKSVQLECDAIGQPTPLISWTSLKDRQTINSKILRIERAQVNHSGLYECLAVNFAIGRGENQLTADNHLRKVVKLTVSGKFDKV